MDYEEEIIKQITAGNEEALRMLYENTSKSVYQYIFSFVNNKEIAEDLMIETYIQVWLSAKRFKGDSKVLTWIFGIARNLTMNEIKKKAYSHLELTNSEPESAEQFNITSQ
ncbi:MAG: sigma-70 family RNA polymerase sigma factor, partial [Thermodesulfovibrio sp.]|nr:sigma-70 family RNA polymerase sigma factor [Thermodesulfovibrio sp.]